MVAEQKPIGFELPKRSSYLSRSQSFESKPEDELPSAPKRAPPERERPMPRNLFPVYPRSGMGNGFEDEEVSVWEGIVLVYEKFVSAVLDIAASGFVFCAVQTMESIIVLCIAAGATSFFYFYQDGDISVRLDWFFVSFAVVFPLVFFIGEGHRRREFALENLGQLKSSTLNYYLAHRDWVTDTELPQGHVALVTSLLGSLLSDMIAYFLTPRIYTRNYFYWGWRGKKMIAWIEANRKFHLGRISASVKKMSTCNKRLKAAGLEAGEKSRLEQYQSLITTSFYKMSNVKEYRTPQGVRSLARFYVVIMPLFFGPYYAWVAEETGSFVFALFLSLFGSLALVALLNVATDLEDPFTEFGRDSIRIMVELEELIKALDFNFYNQKYHPTAPSQTYALRKSPSTSNQARGKGSTT